jgi:hypothetical protein
VADRAFRDRWHTQDGLALVVVLTTVTLMLALGGSLIVLSATDARIAASYQDGRAALYAAEGVLHFVTDEWRRAPDAEAVLAGSYESSFVDGDPGERRVGQETLDLAALTNVERCGRPDACTALELAAVTSARPWGANNPRWRLYAHGWMADLVPRAPDVYVVAWVGDDPYEIDGDPVRDGTAGVSPGSGMLAVRVHAYSVRGARRALDGVVAGVPARPHLIAWAERR